MVIVPSTLDLNRRRVFTIATLVCIAIQQESTLNKGINNVQPWKIELDIDIIIIAIDI